MSALRSYFHDLTGTVGTAWNRFWFVPSDPFTLCVLRVLTGLVAIYFVGSFSFDLVSYFGPDGLLPISTATQLRGDSWTGFTMFQWSSDPGELWTLHVLGLVILVLFTLGCFTRVTSILALLVVLSYIHRGPQFTSEFEPVLTMVMFYLCIGPCGAYLSFDQWRRQRAPKTHVDQETAEKSARFSHTATISLRLIQLHLCAIYFMMALGKINTYPWWIGTAVWILFSMPDSRVVDLSQWLEDHSYVRDLLTHGIVAFELTFGFLIWNRLARPVVLIVGVFVWGLLALATGMFAFCAMMLIANLVFVSPASMRALFGAFSRGEATAAAAT